MKKFEYDNATVYITIPTEEQIRNIHKATERFVRKLVKEGLLQNEQRRDNYGTSRNDINARKRN